MTKQLLELYFNLRELKQVVNLMENLQKKGLEPTFEMMNTYLDTAIRLDSRERIIESLRMFKKASIYIIPSFTTLF